MSSKILGGKCTLVDSCCLTIGSAPGKFTVDSVRPMDDSRMVLG